MIMPPKNKFELSHGIPNGLYRHLVIQVMLLILSMNAFGTSSELFEFDASRFRLWVIFYGVLSLVCYLNMYLFVPKLFLKKRYLNYLSAIMTEVMVFLILIIFAQPDNEPESGVSGNLSFVLINLLASFLNIFIVILSTTTIMLFRYWIQENERVRKLDITTRKAEVELLKSQINPHFLFNTLNNANVLLKRSSDEASRILFKLEDLLTYQLEDCMREKVFLSDDIHFLTDYLNLEKIRRDCFDFTCHSAGNTGSVRIPPLLFIPFVENAVKYNPESGSCIAISFSVKEKTLLFTCENSKSGSYEKKEVGGLGLSNIRRRLELLYPHAYRLQIIERPKIFRIELSIENV